MRKENKIINEHFFDEISSEDKAYVLGFWFADGCLYYNKQRNKYRIQFSLGENDADYLGMISRVLTKNNANHVAIMNNGWRKNGSAKRKAELQIHSQRLCCALINNGGMVRKSLSAIFPASINNVFLQKHFIRGYFDGDGCIYNDIKARIAICGTLSFLTEISSIIEQNVPIKTHIYKRKNCKILYLCVNGRQQVKKMCDWIYQDATIFLPRKYNLYVKMCQDMEQLPVKTLLSPLFITK